jgi:hypothetical protein
MTDPFAVLGIPTDATLDDARAARRLLAREHHPDHGGSAAMMQQINWAFDAVVGHLTGRKPLSTEPEVTRRQPRPQQSRNPPVPPRRAPVGRPQRDDPSFTIDLLPVDAFEALTIVLAVLGDVHSEEPPYVLDGLLADPAPCWCLLELLPEAGGTTVMLTVAAADDGPAPDVDDVRDRLVAELNQLSWPV